MRIGAHMHGTTRRPGVGTLLLAPIRVLAGLASVVIMALVAIFTLGVALVLSRRMQRRAQQGGTWVGRGGPVGGGRAGGATGANDAKARADRGSDAPPGVGGGDGAAAGDAARAPHQEPRPKRGGSYAEVIEAWPVAFIAAAGLTLGSLAGAPPVEAKILIPMDDRQTDHLKAYGLTYWVLTRGQKAEWLLNYRGGSFLMEEDPTIVREANVRGVSLEPMGGAAEAAMRAEVEDNNMEAVALEKPPKVAVYIPPNTPPWDDAVTLALEYAEIPYEKLWDEQVVRGDLAKYDWLHLHHEDFTAQHGKFYAAYRNMPWYKEEEQVQKAMADKLGYPKVTHLKAAVALAIKEYIFKGGFMFSMCSATDTYDIALSAAGVDIVEFVYDGDPADPQAQDKLQYDRALAFKDFRLIIDPMVYRFSDIDVTQEAARRGPNTFFTLFDFSAKNDPVPTMLIQNHVNAVAEFLGQTTGFRRTRLKSGALILGEVENTEEVKYIHGQFGRGTFTFLGGHDPEDYQHMVGDPPTELSRYKHSPGYRLILNNVLFPAAEKKKQRT